MTAADPHRTLTTRSHRRVGRGGYRCRVRLVFLAVLAVAVLAEAPGASAVIGGTPAAPLTWNWNARLEITTPHQDEVCSGSVVSASVILTAAHCVIDEATNTNMNP